MMALSKQLREHALFVGEEVVFEKPIVSLDLEFSLMDITIFKRGKLKKAFKSFEVIEVGAICHYPEGYQYSFENFVKPKFRNYVIDKKIKDLTGIKEKDLKNGVLFEEAYNNFMQYYKPGETFLLTWGNGDLPVLKKMCEKYRLPYLIDESDFIDVSKEFHQFYKIDKYYKFSLEKALEYLQIDCDQKHRATADAAAALDVFMRIINDAA